MLGKLSYSFLGLEQLPNFILCTFNTSESSIKVFVGIISPATLSFFSSQPFSSFMPTSWPQSCSGCTSRVSRMVSNVNIPVVSYFFYNPLYIGFRFCFQHYHLPFLCCTFIFIGQFLLSIIHFCKISQKSSL